jgi:hypothetical protein
MTAPLAQTFTEDNAFRFTPDVKNGHVESYFLRANHPTERKAVWLKATILAPLDGPAVAEAWCCTFDGDAGRVWGKRVTVPAAEATFGDEIDVGGCRLKLGLDEGSAVGTLGDRSWDLKWRPVAGALGAPLFIPFSRKLIEAPFPKSKLVTPSPALRFSGTMRWGDETVDLDGWTGMQGHNWGNQHAHTYAWGQCVFLDGDGEPYCMAEGFSARILIGSWLTPVLSGLTVRHGGRAYRFSRLVDLWRQRAEMGASSWSLRMRGSDGEAMLSMRARPEDVACLGYTNPDGHLSYCLNSKMAATTLRVNPVNGDAFECHSPHGGALEFLQRDPDPRYPDVV